VRAITGNRKQHLLHGDSLQAGLGVDFRRSAIPNLDRFEFAADNVSPHLPCFLDLFADPSRWVFLSA